ncbi:hypothetical protein [Brucella tritici]|uniref:hypothetical protein n=1 Tax=Brucella tritici TaxID=94626 RepID=UPI00200168A4|nr:hypothetical protein [Brucella tritici]
MNGIISIVKVMILWSALLIILLLFVTQDAFSEEKFTRLSARLNEKGLPVIDIPILGKLESVIIDTGSDTALHINEDTRLRLGTSLIKAGSIRTMDIAGKVNQLQSYRITSLPIGDINFTNLLAADLKPWGLNFAPNNPSDINASEMVIGRTFFKGKAILLDYKAGFIEIMSPESGVKYVNKHGFYHWDMSDSKDGLIVEIKSEEKPLRFIVDTATTVTLIKKSSVNNEKRIACSSILASLDDDTCNAISIPNGTDMHDKQIEAVVVDSDFSGLNADGILGANFLLSNPILIDFSTSQLYMESE